METPKESVIFRLLYFFWSEETTPLELATTTSYLVHVIMHAVPDQEPIESELRTSDSMGGWTYIVIIIAIHCKKGSVHTTLNGVINDIEWVLITISTVIYHTI